MWSANRSFVALLPLLLLACGGDSSTNDAGPDATTQDVTTQDVATQDVVAQDVTTQDSGQDGGAQDATADAANDGATSDAAGDGGLAELCVSTGGTVATAQCCKNTTDFPSTCTVGPCGCSPQNSHTVQTCNCPTNKCFTAQQGCH